METKTERSEHNDQDDFVHSDTAPAQANSAGQGIEHQLDPESSGATEAERLNDLDWHLDFDIAVSRRYQIALAKHFTRLSDYTTVLSLIGGSAAVAGALGHGTQGELWGGLLVTITTAASLAFHWPENARHHRTQYQRYTNLERRRIELMANPTRISLNQLRIDFVEIEADESATLKVLSSQCHNEEVNRRGLGDQYRVHLRWWQRLAAPYISLPPNVLGG